MGQKYRIKQFFILFCSARSPVCPGWPGSDEEGTNGDFQSFTWNFDPGDIKTGIFDFDFEISQQESLNIIVST
jgi:hypothetical protein